MTRTLITILVFLATSPGLMALAPLSKTSVSIASDFEGRPTFSRANEFILLDNGRALFLGTSARFETRHTVYILKTDSMVRVPLLLSESLTGQLGKGHVHSLVHYNSDDGRMAIIWERERQGRKELVAVSGRLVQGEISRSVVLAKQEGRELLAVRPTIGHSGSGPFPLAISRQNEIGRYKYEDRGRVAISLIHEDGSVRPVCQFSTPYRPHTLFAGNGLAFLAEYSEDSEGGAKPEGHIITLSSGQRRAIPVDYVIYGAAFSPDGSRLYAASSMNGTLSEYDTASGVMRSRIPIGTHGHVLGYAKPDTLFWIRNDGIVSIATTPAPRMTDYLGFTSIQQGFWHTDGSFITGNTAWVKNGDELWKMNS